MPTPRQTPLDELIAESRTLRTDILNRAQRLVLVQQAIQEKARELLVAERRTEGAYEGPSGVVYMRYANAGGRSASAVVQALSRLGLTDRMVLGEQEEQKRQGEQKGQKPGAQKPEAKKPETARSKAPAHDPFTDLFGED